MPQERLNVVEVECRTILNRSAGSLSDYTLNAYQGCAFGCSYCYVPAMRARRGQEDASGWGTWVQVKVNAPDVLRRQMQRVAPDARIFIGTATDSWQPLEKRYGITRRILEELTYYTNNVSLLTRSPLLLRDIDMLLRLQSVSIGVSLPTFDERARRVFEPHAPTVAGRVHLVRRLIEAGLPIRLFWCPILHGVSDTPQTVEDYLRQAAELGVARVVCDTMNYMPFLGAAHMRLLQQYRREVAEKPALSLAKPALSREIARWAAHYGVDCRL